MSNNFTISNLINLRYCINHVNAELDAAVSMIRSRLRDSTNTIVTISEKLDPQTVVFIGQLVEPIVNNDQCRWCTMINITHD